MSIDPEQVGNIRGVERTREAGQSAYATGRESAVAGLAVLVPILITLLVFQAVAGYLIGVLDLPVQALESVGVSPDASQLIVRASVAVLLGAFVLVVGFLTRFQYGEVAIEGVDSAIQAVPGIGAVYTSFREMGDMMIESDAENFRDVRLVEFPNEETYTMGFLTADTPGPVREAAGGDEMVTLFLPLAPNPVMGGHLVHVPADRVRDVDMTVEEGIRTVVTSGVATGDTAGKSGLSREKIRRMSAYASDPFDPGGLDLDGDRRHGSRDAERVHEYERYVRPDPAKEDAPSGVEAHGRRETLGRGESRPTEVEDGDGNIGREESRPAEVEDGEGRIGREESRPADVEDGEETIGDDADTPDDVGDDA